MPSLTQRIAAVLGPTLVAVTSSEALNLDIWHDVQPTLVYLNGLMFFVGGVFIVTTHRLWRRPAEITVTASGWLLIAAGLFRMFAPRSPQLGPGPLAYAVIAALGALGVALCVVALRNRRE